MSGAIRDTAYQRQVAHANAATVDTLLTVLRDQFS